jgi:hypothetical protein
LGGNFGDDAEEVRAIIRHTRAFGPNTPMSDDVVEFLHSKPEGPHKFATILVDKALQLRALDRYERRALAAQVCYPDLRRGASPLEP